MITALLIAAAIVWAVAFSVLIRAAGQWDRAVDSASEHLGEAIESCNRAINRMDNSIGILSSPSSLTTMTPHTERVLAILSQLADNQCEPSCTIFELRGCSCGKLEIREEFRSQYDSL